MKKILKWLKSIIFRGKIKPKYKVGDYVQIGNHKGFIVEINKYIWEDDTWDYNYKVGSNINSVIEWGVDEKSLIKYSGWNDFKDKINDRMK